MFKRGADSDEIQEAQNELKHRVAIRQLLDGAAKEFGFAVGDIRNELVDRAWFDRDASTMHRAQQGMDIEDFDRGSPRDYSHEDVYGCDPDWGQMRDIAHDDPQAGQRGIGYESDPAAYRTWEAEAASLERGDREVREEIDR